MTTTIKVRKGRDDKSPAEFTYDFPTNLGEAVSRWDGSNALEHVVYGLAITAAKQQLVDFIRRLQKEKVKGRGKNKTTQRALTIEEIQERVNAWKPEVAKRSRAAIGKAAKVVGSLSEEERQALLEQLMGGGGVDDGGEESPDDGE